MASHNHLHRNRTRSTRLNFEWLEDRRVLSTMADIVFMVDNSASESQGGLQTKGWLRDVVSGDVNHNALKDPGETNLSERLAAQGVTDVRYGLVAFGEIYDPGGSNRFAHSEVVDTDATKSVFDRLFSSGAAPGDHISDLGAALDHLITEERGGQEDGWDAIEHAIAEYDFRPGAVPIFVLLQNEEGRIVTNQNATLTRNGILSALKSKNVILNTLTVGRSDTPSKLFDLEPYGLNSDIRIVGVDADGADGVSDGVHNYYSIDTDTTNGVQTPTATTSDALQISFNGSNTGESGMVASGKSILISQGLSGGIATAASGYSAKSVPFEMVDISQGASFSNPINYSFNFFGTTYNRLWVNQDGTITFPDTPNGNTNINPGPDNVDLSQAATLGNGPQRPMIAALWDDLTSGLLGEPSGQIRWKLVNVDGVGQNDLVIQWSNYLYVGDNPPFDPITIQAVLFSNGDIRLTYQDLDSLSGRNTQGAAHPPDNDTTVFKTGGINATVGIWKGGASPSDPVTIPAGKYVPGPHSINGDALDAGSGESNDSYVRMAWDTGGSAWDVGVVSTFGIDSAPANKLRDEFVGSLARQIKEAAGKGQVTWNDRVVLDVNYGSASAVEQFSPDPEAIGGQNENPTTTQNINRESNSIPFVEGTQTKVHAVFQTARAATSSGSEFAFPGVGLGSLDDGRYIVELFFSQLNTVDREFDIVAEGKTLLNNYNISTDRARIIEDPQNPGLELDAIAAGQFAGVVKRFQVDVNSADGTPGLDLRLVSEFSGLHVNGLRILRADPIPGDYNFNGVVDAADYTVWRDTLNSTTDLRADGDNNGVINLNDYAIWKTAFSSGTGSVLADFSGNGATDIADYFLWSSTEGSTTDLRADCNEDGIVDDADYEIWFDTFGSTLEIGHFGLLSGMFDPDAPPAVVGIALSLPGDVTVDFAGRVGSGDQIRSVPLTAANTLSVTFSQDVVITQGALQITNLDGTSPTISGFAYDAAAQTATWTFASVLDNGRFVVRLSDTVENLDGKSLDGEFFNPTKLSDAGTALFPSGDGDEGGEFRFRFTVLLGDDNHDNIYGSANYQNWQSTEPGMIIVSTTTDDYDADLSFGDVSLREAVIYANSAGSATAIQLPAGRYTLSRTGTESSANVAVNDLDVTGVIAIIGAGPGLSIIDNSGLGSSVQARTFELSGAASRLRLSRLTVANGSSTQSGQVATMTGGATLEIVESAVVNHTAYAAGAAIMVTGSNLVVSRSVVTNNDNTSIYAGSAIYATGTTTNPASVTVGESIFALNAQPTYNGGTSYYAIRLGSYVTKVNHGMNLYDYAGGGFFDTTPGAGDYLGTPQYVVTSAADTFNHADDLEALSLREAADLANQASGPQTVWVPAWRFVLTRDRGTNATDTDVSYGDIDVKNIVSIRGVEGRTSIGWPPGVVDKAIELLGDVNRNGVVDAADYTLWQDQNGASGAWEQFAADVDDDGDVDEDDYDLWSANFGRTLTLSGIQL